MNMKETLTSSPPLATRSEIIAAHTARARRAKGLFRNFATGEGCDPTDARIAMVLAMIETCETDAEFANYRNETSMIFAAQAVLQDKLDAGEVVGCEPPEDQ